MKTWPSRVGLLAARVVAVACVPVALAQVAAATLPPITAIAIAPDKTVIVAGSQAGAEVRSWPSLERVATLPTKLANIHDLAFSPDGTILAVAGGHPAVEGAVEFYRWPERELIRSVNPHDDVVYSIAWHADGREIALASGDNRASIVPVAENSAPRYLDGHSRAVLVVVQLPGGTALLTGGVDHSIRLWDARASTTQRTLANHTGAVTDLKVRPHNGTQSIPMVASAGEDRTVRFWQPTIGRLVRFARLDSAPLALAWTHDGLVLWAACEDGRVRAIDPQTADIVQELPAAGGVAYTVVISPDGNLLAGGSSGQLRRVDARAK